MIRPQAARRAARRPRQQHSGRNAAIRGEVASEFET